MYAAIERARDTYKVEKLIRSMGGTAKEQKRLLNQLVGQLAKAVTTLDRIPPEIHVAISALAERHGTGRKIDPAGLVTDLLRLARGAEDFLDQYEPAKGPPTNVVLELAMRGVLPVFEEVSGVLSLVKDNKHVDCVPTPGSVTSEALILLFRSFDSPASESAVLNMITKVKGNPEEPDSNFDAVIRTHFDELDASLLRNRHERD